MMSRAGKSTNNMYLAFQDKEKHRWVQSKVAKFIGRNDEEETLEGEDDGTGGLAMGMGGHEDPKAMASFMDDYMPKT